MKFERNVATRLPDDLADRLEREAHENLETVACRTRKIIAEHFAAAQKEERT